jgi:biopolymer transport protein ExbD
MRVPSHHNDVERRDDLAMTPMIDVVFLLLIFFVCASLGQIRESLLPTELAAGAIDSQEFRDRPKPFGEVWLFLRPAADGRTEVQVNEGGETYADFGRLKRQLDLLAAATTEIPVILDIAPNVPLGDMIRVFDTCDAAGFESINFATDPAPAAKKKPQR